MKVMNRQGSFLGPNSRAYMARSAKEGPCPSHSPIWNNNGPQSCDKFLSWKIFAPGRLPEPVVAAVNPGCHCHRPDDPGHRPHPRLTYKVNGKSITESFATPAEQRKAEQEIEAFRRYRQLERSFVDVNEKICHARPVEDTLTPQEKKRPKRSTRRSRAK